MNLPILSRLKKEVGLKSDNSVCPVLPSFDVPDAPPSPRAS